VPTVHSGVSHKTDLNLPSFYNAELLKPTGRQNNKRRIINNKSNTILWAQCISDKRTSADIHVNSTKQEIFILWITNWRHFMAHSFPLLILLTQFNNIIWWLKSSSHCVVEIMESSSKCFSCNIPVIRRIGNIQWNSEMWLSKGDRDESTAIWFE